MASIKNFEVKPLPIRDVFPSEEIEGEFYKVPPYQREYVWGKNEWEKLFDDIDDQKTDECPHFLGTIICIEKNNVEKEIVDGQQRLITISILLAALYYKINSCSDQNKDTYLQLLKSKLKRDKSENKLILLPQDQGNNQKDFEYVLKTALNEQVENNESNRKLIKCYKYFLDRISEATKNDNFDELKKLHTKIMQSCLIEIIVFKHQQAFILFESLNNRGRKLTGVDLIKNYLLEKTDKDEREQTINNWKNMLENLTDDYQNQERFFRHYHNVYYGNKATRTNLYEIYVKKIENTGSVDLLKEMLSKSDLYKQILMPESVDDEDLKKSLIDLDHIKGAPAGQLLLYLFDKQKAFKIENMACFVDFIVKFFVRRNLCGKPSTNKLDSIFIEIIKSLEKLKKKEQNEAGVYNTITKRLIEESVNDAEFERELNGDIYDNSANVTRFLLCKLLPKEDENNFWKQQRGKKYEWEIEHILPKADKDLNIDWINMIANGNSGEAKKIQLENMHKIGNLGLLTSQDNKTIGSKEFTTKKETYKRYKSKVKFDDILKKEKWTEYEINQRTENMVEQIMKDFSMLNTPKHRMAQNERTVKQTKKKKVRK